LGRGRCVSGQPINITNFCINRIIDFATGVTFTSIFSGIGRLISLAMASDKLTSAASLASKIFNIRYIGPALEYAIQGAKWSFKSVSGYPIWMGIGGAVNMSKDVLSGSLRNPLEYPGDWLASFTKGAICGVLLRYAFGPRGFLHAGKIATSLITYASSPHIWTTMALKGAITWTVVSPVFTILGSAWEGMFITL
jgi:hypothetical protein